MYYQIQSGARRIALSHLFDADDILLFTNGSSNFLTQFMNFFQEYEQSSRQLVNQAKSAFYLHDKFARRATVISRVTGYSRKNFPFNYLGVPITNGRLQTIYFEQMVDKARHALEGWKSKLLTFGGRLTLIYSVLSSFSIHTLASTVVPKPVLRRIEGLMAQFLWSARGRLAITGLIGLRFVHRRRKEVLESVV